VGALIGGLVSDFKKEVRQADIVFDFLNGDTAAVASGFVGEYEFPGL
jgi:hypothetical protein